MTDLLHILADELKNYTSKPPILNRAILKLAIQDEIGEKPWEKLNYKEWRLSIQKGVKNRLSLGNIKDPDKIIAILLNILNKNQSLIAMSNF